MAEREKPDKGAGEEQREQGGSGSGSGGGGGGAGTAVAKPKRAARTTPKKKPPGMLPPWKVLLHNDDKNVIEFVVNSIVELTPLNEQDAVMRTLEAHESGVSLLLVTHKERAELYKEQFQSKGLTVSIEPAEK